MKLASNAGANRPSTKRILNSRLAAPSSLAGDSERRGTWPALKAEPRLLTKDMVDAAFANGVAPRWSFDPTLLWSELNEQEYRFGSTMAFGTVAFVTAGFVFWSLWNYYLLASAAAVAPLGRRVIHPLDLSAVLQGWNESEANKDEETLQSLVR